MGAGASLLHWTISRERLQRHSRFASGGNRGSGMHVLMTADTVGGVWTYTQELVSGLIQQGIRVTLVSLGKLPSPEQSAWIDALPELDYRPTDYRLEWMQDSERDVEESGNYLESVIREVRPDLLHSNQYCYGTVSPEIPRNLLSNYADCSLTRQFMRQLLAMSRLALLPWRLPCRDAPS